MNPLIDRIKAQITEQRYHGMGAKVRVDTRLLFEILEDYERIDSLWRAEHSDREPHMSLLQRLEIAVQAIWHDERGYTDRVLLTVLEIMQPMIKQQSHDNRIKDYALTHENRITK